MKNFLGKVKNRIRLPVNAVHSFRNNPIDNLSILLYIAVITVSLIGFNVSFVLFLVKGGYSKQIEMIKSLSFISGTDETFTSGTVYILYGNIVGTIIIFLLLSEIILTLILFFANESKTNKIIMIVALLVFNTIGIFFMFINAINTRRITLTEKQEIMLLNALNGTSLKKVSIILILFAVVWITSVITLSILICKSKANRVFKKALKSAVIAFLVIPMILWIIENIIALILTFIFAVIVIIKGYINRCPKCNKFFARKYCGSSIVKEKDVLTNVSDIKFGELEHYHGPAVYHYEKHKTNYKCKYCNYKWREYHNKKQLKEIEQ